jgi:RNA polymerase sigma factor (sigma-70 family)
MLTTAGDLRLVEAVIARDEPAVRRLVERYATSFRNIAWHMTWDSYEAQDLCQEALVRITSPYVLRRYRGDGPLDAYLTSVGVRRMISHRRGQRAARELVLLVGEPPERDGRSRSPEVSVFDRTLSSPLRRALASLPDQARAIVLLIVLGEASYAETATALGLELGTVKSAYHRARVNLQAQLERHDPGPARAARARA